MSDTPTRPLPELHEGLLDAAGVAALFRDVEALTDLREVITKGGPAVRAHGAGVRLAEALDLLCSGRTRGVQLRYHHGSEEWWDTILALPSGFRVVRIRQDWSTPPS